MMILSLVRQHADRREQPALASCADSRLMPASHLHSRSFLVLLLSLACKENAACQQGTTRLVLPPSHD